MFYKLNYETQTKAELTKRGSVEFAYALWERMKESEDVELFVSKLAFEEDFNTVVGYVKQTERDFNSEHPTDNKKYTFIDPTGDYVRREGLSLLDSRYLCDDKRKRELLSCNDQKVENLIELKQIYPEFNHALYLKSLDLIADCYLLKDKGVIYDNNGQEYSYTITKNSNLTACNEIVMDVMKVYKDNEQIAYLNAQYTNKDIFDKLYSSELAIIETKKPTREQKIQLLNKQRVNFDEDTIDIYFQLTLSKIKKSLKSDFEHLESLNNISSPDYSRVDERFEKKGIGTQMYLKVAEYIGKQGMEFRGSFHQSPKAKGLWQKLKRDYPNHVESRELAGNSYIFLKVNEGEDIYNKPQQKIKNKRVI